MDIICVQSQYFKWNLIFQIKYLVETDNDVFAANPMFWQVFELMFLGGSSRGSILKRIKTWVLSVKQSSLCANKIQVKFSALKDLRFEAKFSGRFWSGLFTFFLWRVEQSQLLSLRLNLLVWHLKLTSWGWAGPSSAQAGTWPHFNLFALNS